MFMLIWFAWQIIRMIVIIGVTIYVASWVYNKVSGESFTISY